MARDRTLGLRLRAIDKMSTTIDRIQRKFPKLTRAIKKASRVSRIFNAQTKRMRQNLQKIGGGLKRFGTQMTLGVTLPILAAGAAGVKMFATFEQGLRGVEKTTGLAREDVAKLGKTFDQLSTEIPVSTREMLELAQAGGQLGVKGVKNIEKFTIVMAKLSRASDVTGEEGAKAIARILTVTGDGIGNIDRFASALVDLGNNAAASESEILAVATRVAGQIGRFDVASDKVLGIATALKSLGKRAESSGSVVGRAFDAIDQAIKGGGEKMQFLSKLTGIAGKDLKKVFKKDATEVFQKFVEGLSKVEKGGGNLIKVMGALGLKGVRINDILGTLAKRPEVLAEQLDRASAATKKNIALQKEFEVQIDSFGSEMIVLANTFKSLLRLIGEELAPTVKFFGDVLRKIFNFLRNNPGMRTFVIILGVLLAVLGPILIAFGAFLIILPALITGAGALGIALLPFIGTIALVAAGLVAAIAVGVFFFTQWEKIIAFFDDNPFFSFLKFLFFLLNPLGQILAIVRLVIGAFSGLDGLTDAARDILPKFAGDALFGEKSLGSSKGAAAGNRGIAGGQNSTPVSGQIDVLFKKLPLGTIIKSKSDGLLDLNLGISGGIL